VALILSLIERAGNWVSGNSCGDTPKFRLFPFSGMFVAQKSISQNGRAAAPDHVKIKSMPEDLSQIITLFQREYLFQGLENDQLFEIAQRFQRVYFERNTIVFTEGSPPDCFYMVLNGSVRVTRNIRGEEKFINILGPGDFFGEQALLFDRPRSATIATITRSTLLRLDEDHFHDLLKDFPGILMNLSATADSRALARRLSFPWLGSDEVIYFLTRKHEFFLYLSLVVPILMLVGSIPVLAFGFVYQTTPFFQILIEVIGFTMLILSVVWGVWNAIDWSNDYYIVTNQRVIWLEKVIGLYDSRREAPLETILAVNVTSSQIGRILDYGNITVRTFTGGILMRNARRPKIFSDFVNGYKQRVLYLSKQEEDRQMKEAIQQAIDRRLNPELAPTITVEAQNQPVVKPPPKKDDADIAPGVIATFLKVRYEKDGVITYRKHWFLLLQKIWLPLIALATLTLLSMYYIYQWVNTGDPLLGPFAAFVLAGIFYWVVFIWLGYLYLDWNNDIYRLTPDQILDIERKPLGEEIKKSAPLGSILSIEHERENILQNLLNFGYVTINVGETRFIFRGVYNPDDVHQDISDYRELLNRRRRESEAKRERERMIQWLMAYYDETVPPEDLDFDEDAPWDLP
jgi:hypothetical protein